MRNPYPRQCPICGKTFTPASATKQKYCSVEHSMIGHQRKQNDRRKKQRLEYKGGKYLRTTRNHCEKSVGDPDPAARAMRIKSLRDFYKADEHGARLGLKRA